MNWLIPLFTWPASQPHGLTQLLSLPHGNLPWLLVWLFILCTLCSFHLNTIIAYSHIPGIQWPPSVMYHVLLTFHPQGLAQPTIESGWAGYVCKGKECFSPAERLFAPSLSFLASSSITPFFKAGVSSPYLPWSLPHPSFLPVRTDSLFSPEILLSSATTAFISCLYCKLLPPWCTESFWRSGTILFVFTYSTQSLTDR